MGNWFSSYNENIFKLSDIPLGKCMRCGLQQTSPGKGGFWINGTTNNWACFDCKYGKNGGTEIRSYPISCESCSYSDVKWYQGHVYHCPRCINLNIKHCNF